MPKILLEVFFFFNLPKILGLRYTVLFMRSKRIKKRVHNIEG